MDKTNYTDGGYTPIQAGEVYAGPGVADPGCPDAPHTGEAGSGRTYNYAAKGATVGIQADTVTITGHIDIGF
jgi:hypothetical protein